MPNQPKAEELCRRLAVVERTISERGWSLAVKRALAAEFGVHKDTVDNYRLRLIDGMKVEYDSRDRATRRAEFLTRLQGHQRAALAAGRLGPLAAMMNLEMKILGVEAAAGREAEASDSANLTKEELLERLASELDPSMVEAIRMRQRH